MVSSLLGRNDAGMYDAINEGLAHTKGEIFAWLNCDEQYHHGTILILIPLVRPSVIRVQDRGHAYIRYL